MKFDPRYSSQIKPVFRVFAGIISIPMLLFGLMALREIISCEQAETREIIEFGLPQLFFGTLMLVAALRGRLPRSFDGPTTNSHESNDETLLHETTRKSSLKMLGSTFGAVLILSFMLYMFEKFTMFWWFTAVYSIFWLYMYYLSSQFLLLKYGFHNLLAITFIFPVIVLLIGVISPSTLEKREDNLLMLK